METRRIYTITHRTGTSDRAEILQNLGCIEPTDAQSQFLALMREYLSLPSDHRSHVKYIPYADGFIQDGFCPDPDPELIEPAIPTWFEGPGYYNDANRLILFDSDTTSIQVAFDDITYCLTFTTLADRVMDILKEEGSGQIFSIMWEELSDYYDAILTYDTICDCVECQGIPKGNTFSPRAAHRYIILHTIPAFNSIDDGLLWDGDIFSAEEISLIESEYAGDHEEYLSNHPELPNFESRCREGWLHHWNDKWDTLLESIREKI